MFFFDILWTLLTGLMYALPVFGIAITVVSLFTSTDDGPRVAHFSLAGVIFLVVPFLFFALSSPRGGGMSGAEVALFIVAIGGALARWICITVIQSRNTKAFKQALELFALRRK